MGIDDIVNVSITAESSSPTRPGFGTALLACYHTGHGLDRVLEYASPKEMIDDGWTTSDVPYKLASRVFAQNPRVTKVKIGRRANAPVQVVHLTALDSTVGRVQSVKVGSTTYSYTVAAPGSYTAVKVAITTGALTGESTLDSVACSAGDRILSAQGLATDGIYICAAGAWSRATDADTAAEFVFGKQVAITSGTVHGGQVAVFSTGPTAITLGTTAQRWQFVANASAANLAAVALQLGALIDVNADVTALATGDTIACTTGTAGLLLEYSAWSRYLAFEDVSADPGIASDLAAMLLEDDDWYGLTLDTINADDINEAAEWTEANGKLAAFSTADTGCGPGIMQDLSDAAYARSGAWYSGKSTQSFLGAAILGDRFPYDPGSDTWVYKTVAGVTVDRLTGSARTAILNANGNLYNVVAGLNVTEGGTTGSGEYYDTTRFIDWLHAEVQINVFALLANNQKIPFTNAGVDMVKSVIDAALRLGVVRGGLVDGTTYVTAPDVADIPAADKLNRHLPDVKFGGELAGAIHTMNLSGTLSI